MRDLRRCLSWQNNIGTSMQLSRDVYAALRVGMCAVVAPLAQLTYGDCYVFRGTLFLSLGCRIFIYVCKT